MDVAMLALGGLTRLASWQLVHGPGCRGFIHGLMGMVRPSAAAHDEARRVIRS